jgi:hypothetical protein
MNKNNLQTWNVNIAYTNEWNTHKALFLTLSQSQTDDKIKNILHSGNISLQLFSDSVSSSYLSKNLNARALYEVNNII